MWTENEEFRGVADGVSEGVAVSSGEALADGVGVGVGDGAGFGDGLGEGFGVGDALEVFRCFVAGDGDVFFFGRGVGVVKSFLNF